MCLRHLSALASSSLSRGRVSIWEDRRLEGLVWAAVGVAAVCLGRDNQEAKQMHAS